MIKGRKEEIRKLQEFVSSDARVLMMYGRVGMGKTTLLKEFLKKQSGMYYNAYSTTAKRQMAYLSKAFGSKEELSLEELLQKMTLQEKDQSFVFVIDNYGAFVKSEPAFAKKLHDFVKEKWAVTNMKLILCEDSYLNATKMMISPGALWQDFDPVCMELKPLYYYESQLFFKDALPEEKVFYYGITGGIPALLCNLENSVEDSVKKLYLSENEPAYLPEKIFGTELREMSYYNSLLATLASGKNRVNQISEEVEKPKDVVVPYLTTLMNIGAVKKENPITEPNNRKKTRYSISNIADVFWYSYVVPFMDEYYSDARGDILEKHILGKNEKFLQRCFVAMCKDYLWNRSNAKELDFHIDEIGSWWENDDEKRTTAGFDLAALGEQNGESAILFARCFYQDNKVDMRDLKKLIDLTKHAKSEENTYYVIFSKSGFASNAITAASAIKNIITITLDDVCAWNQK